MNVLYFDQSDMWSPTTDDLNDEYEVTVEEQDYYSMSKSSLRRGKRVALHIATLYSPSIMLKINIDNE